MLIDSHAHICYTDRLDTNEIIDSMQVDNLESIITIGTNVLESQKAVEVAENNKNIYATVGIHPEYASEIKMQCLLEIENLAKSKKVVAIGEIGLDYHYEGFDKQKQFELFIAQLELAERLDLPVCIHTRDAAEDTYNILKEHATKLKRKGVMHCFSETSEWAEKFLNLGFYISFAGNITFKKSDRSFLKNIPIDKIMVETDCPFLSPEPVRGTINKPKNVNYIAQKIADVLEMDFKYFADRTRENTKRLYYKIKNA